jgi:hypothetical protein
MIAFSAKRTGECAHPVLRYLLIVHLETANLLEHQPTMQILEVMDHLLWYIPSPPVCPANRSQLGRLL